jgi:hypothetical protein
MPLRTADQVVAQRHKPAHGCRVVTAAAGVRRPFELAGEGGRQIRKLTAHRRVRVGGQKIRKLHQMAVGVVDDAIAGVGHR